MSPEPLSHHNETGSKAQRMAALLTMGFECVEGPVTTDAYRVAAGRWKVSQSVPAMGTVVSLTAIDVSQARAEEALGVAIDEMERTVALLNRFEDSSAVGVLNSEGRIDAAPDELLQVLGRAAGLHRLSGGAFDITVQPVVDLYRDRRAAGLSGLPPDAQLAAALERVDGRGVRIDGRRVSLRGVDGVTLDGIAKGLVVDATAAALARCGVDDYLINAGGDIRTSGSRGDGSPWTIAVRDPDEGEASPARVHLHAGAVATSGSYEIYFDDDRTCHHLVRSDNGRSPHASMSVTVCAPSAMQADALATTVFLMGPAAGTGLIESIPGCASLVITRARQLIYSSGWVSSARSRPTAAGQPASEETR